MLGDAHLVSEQSLHAHSSRQNCLGVRVGEEAAGLGSGNHDNGQPRACSHPHCRTLSLLDGGLGGNVPGGLVAVASLCPSRIKGRVASSIILSLSSRRHGENREGPHSMCETYTPSSRTGRARQAKMEPRRETER